MAGFSPEQRLLDMIKKAQGKVKLKKDLNVFTKINIVLTGLVIVISAVFLADIFSSNYRVPELDIKLEPQKDEIMPVPEASEEDIDKFIENTVQRGPSLSKEEATRDLSLLGIIKGDNNQAIIEDKKIGNTFFVYQGDSFGEFRLIGVQDRGVVLDYKGEKIELNM